MPGFAVWVSRSVWQAEEAVANLPLRLAVRVHCGHQVRRGTLGVLMHSRGIQEYSQRTQGVTIPLEKKVYPLPMCCPEVSFLPAPMSWPIGPSGKPKGQESSQHRNC